MSDAPAAARPRLAAVIFDWVIIAGDFALGRAIGAATDATLSPEPGSAPATLWGVRFGVIVAAALGGHLAALVFFRNEVRGGPGTPAMSGSAAAGLVFFGVMLGLSTTSVTLGTLLPLIGLDDGSAGSIALILLFFAATVVVYVWLCTRVQEPRPKDAPVPGPWRLATCVVLMYPMVLVAMGPIDGLAARTDPFTSFEGFWSKSFAVVVGSALLAAMTCMTAWFPRFLATRVLGRGLSGWHFFLGMWAADLVQLLQAPVRSWLAR